MASLAAADDHISFQIEKVSWLMNKYHLHSYYVKDALSSLAILVSSLFVASRHFLFSIQIQMGS